MPQIESHLEWCLRNKKGLVKTKPDINLAQAHLKKSEYNFSVLLLLEKQRIYDWALNVGFYAIYHCLLGILAKYGYESRNQSCTLSMLLKLIKEGKLILSKDLVLQFDTLEINPSSPTVRMERETSTYGIGTSIDLQQIKRLKGLILDIQRETIRVLGE